MTGCKNCPELQMKQAEKIPQKEGGLYKEYSNAHDSSIEGYITPCRDDISPCLKAAQTSSILCRSTLSKQHTHTRFQHGANMAVVHCSLRPTSPYGSLCANIMSSMKPEIHNVMQRCQRRTESQVNTHKFDEDGHVCPEICSWTYRQTDRHTYHNTLPLLLWWSHRYVSMTSHNNPHTIALSKNRMEDWQWGS